MVNEETLPEQTISGSKEGEKNRIAKLLHERFCSVDICKLNWCGVKVCSHTDKLWQDRAEKLIAFSQKNKVDLLELEKFFADF